MVVDVAGTSRRTLGQVSLAGAQPKIALVERKAAGGDPVAAFPRRGSSSLPPGSSAARVLTFADEVAIVVDRFDRVRHARTHVRVHQEDVCQALGVMPTRKYESGGGPGIPAIVSLLREYSLDPVEDIERFVQATALNWVIAATDAHAKNYALLHAAGGGVASGRPGRRSHLH